MFKPRLRYGYLIVLLLIVNGVGCRSTPSSRGWLGKQVDAFGARVSFTRWNLGTTYEEALSCCQCKCAAHDNRENCARALELASRSCQDLESLLRRQPAPPLTVLHGKWFGINKGLGAAAIGLTQDIKVFQTEGCSPRGYNLAVRQVPIAELPCRGFEEVESVFRCHPNSIGNFAIIEPCLPCQPLKLDYTRVANSWLSPSKRLVDELVMVDHDLLLGRANIKVGTELMPIAYFVLHRAPSECCDAYANETLPAAITSTTGEESP